MMDAKGSFGAASVRRLLIATTVLCSGLAAPAVAQTAPNSRPVIDGNGVDLATGDIRLRTKKITIGDLTFSEAKTDDIGYDSFAGGLWDATSEVTIFINGNTIKFTKSGSTYTPENHDGSTLTVAGGYPVIYTYTTAAGVKYEFEENSSELMIAGYSIGNFDARLIKKTRPDGSTKTWHYREVETSNCPEPEGDEDPEDCEEEVYQRVEAITSSAGYMLKATYASNSANSSFNRVTSVTALDRSVDYCSPNGYSCTGLSQTWPKLTFSQSGSGSTITKTTTDQAGRQHQTVTVNDRVTQENTDNSGTNERVMTYFPDGKLKTLTENGVLSSYAYTVSGGSTTVTTTHPDSSTTTRVIDNSDSVLNSSTNRTGDETEYDYDAQDRLIKTTFPEGNYIQLTRDARGNVTQTLQVGKPGSGASNITTSANYDAACTNVVKCNKPNYTIDAGGNRTDYTYDATHGQVTRVRLPAPASGQSRPEINYSYSSLYSQVKNASGVLVNGPTPEAKLTLVRACATAATCSGSANETRIAYEYNTPNLLLTKTTVSSGNNAITSSTSYTYDAKDNLVSVDGPLAGSGDTVHYIYDMLNRRRGVIGIDPDGGGARLRVAERYTFDDKDNVTKVEIGTVTGTTETALNAMSVTQTIDRTFDTNDNLIKQAVSGSGSTHSVVQYSYDTQNRLLCAARRMNPAVYASLPSSACTPGTSGTFGPDRITKNHYDATGRVTKVQTALGTADQADEVTLSYTANGRAADATDGENNRTTYEYDGHDRLRKTRYPVATQGTNSSSTTDYVQLTYDAASNVTQYRLRDGQTISYTYDNLHRRTNKNLPGSESDATYAYDLLGRLTSASQGGITNSFTIDALGRVTAATSPQGTVSYLYNAASRRTRMTYPGTGLYIDYDYDTAGNITKIRENGATTGVGVLATYAYDNLGRRTSITFGNGAVQSFTYDAAQRVSGLTHNLAGSSNDLTLGFAYNPAHQVTSTTRSNDQYAWSGHYNVDRTYTANGLNQLTNAGGVTLSYDARGNLTTSGSDTYTYSSENFLTAGPGGAALSYDPLGRLYESSNTALGATRYTYDGLAMIAEYNASNQLQRRYVHGPGIDTPLVWYEGTGTTDRRFLMADERGSIISVTNSSGGILAHNAYDEYGIPDAGNLGRFGYTGQAWLPELGMSYYKARMYSPTLGRFMQTDPIGYADGMNMYAYVGGDPINFVDPLGLCESGSRITRDDDDEEILEIVVCGTRFVNTGGGAGGGGGKRDTDDDADEDDEKRKSDEPCPSNGSIFATIADYAETTGDVADGIAIGAAGLGLITAPTGAGGAFFGTTALVAGGVGRIASGVAVAADFIDGNYASAGANAAGIVGGRIAGRVVGNVATNAYARNRTFNNLSAGQERRVNALSNTAAAAGSRVVSRTICN